MVFRRFISVFARPEHPLALFLDDLQWLDAATLDLIEDLLNEPDMRHLMLIGAYRDNEVDPTHPLMRKLQEIRQAGSILHDIVLAPLAREDLEQLIADTLHYEPDRATPLAQLVLDKTGGNPFFAIRFIISLADEGLLAFDETIFDIVNQLNRGAALISSREKREQLAELNLTAGRRAKASTAYASALTYLVAGAALLGENCWERRHDLTFALELNRAECEYVTAQLGAAEERLAALATHAATPVERAAVAGLRIDLHTTLDQSDRAITVGLEYLRHVGVDWSPHPSEEEARREYDRIWSQLGARAIEDLIDLPLLSDPASVATLDILTKLVTYATLTDSNLQVLVGCREAIGAPDGSAAGAFASRTITAAGASTAPPPVALTAC
jgi:predicted ATPase